MPRGSRPGERRGGRQKGAPNRASQARQAEVKATGQTPLDVMIQAMRYFGGLAARHQPNGPDPDEKKFERFLRQAADIANDAAPYVHPKLAQTTLRGDEDKPIRARVEVEFV